MRQHQAADAHGDPRGCHRRAGRRRGGGPPRPGVRGGGASRAPATKRTHVGRSASAAGGERRRTNDPGPPSTSEHPYTFTEYRALPVPAVIHPPASAALRMLHRLARDPGILGIMRKHKWRVPLLAEMPPEGKVGVSESCVLGYNVNAGQEIHLRLRTDDCGVSGGISACARRSCTSSRTTSGARTTPTSKTFARSSRASARRSTGSSQGTPPRARSATRKRASPTTRRRGARTRPWRRRAPAAGARSAARSALQATPRRKIPASPPGAPPPNAPRKRRARDGVFGARGCATRTARGRSVRVRRVRLACGTDGLGACPE